MGSMYKKGVLMRTIKNILKWYVIIEIAMDIISLIYLKKYRIGKVQGIGIYKLPDRVLHKFGLYIACATQFGLIPAILVDNTWGKINANDKDAANFILYHEVGHHKLGHVKDNLKTLFIDKKKPSRNIDFEIEADTYAIHEIGINAAIKFIDAIDFLPFVPDNLYIESERIDNILNIWNKD